MSEEITNNGTDTTQVTNDVVNEENSINDQTTQQETVEDGNEVVENSNDVETQDDGQQELQQEQKQPTVEELQSKLKEYQVREEEEKMIREQLGISDNIDSQTFSYMNIDQQIVNEGKQVYLRLCNEYGIDANPANIDASVNKLKETDPAKAYEFQKRFEDLGNEIEYRRGMVQQQHANYEINKFATDYNQILNSSPAINELLTSYVKSYAGQGNVYQELQGVLEAIMPAYQEAFNAGRQFALQDKAKKDTSGVSGGVATANTQTYSSGTTFTREQIRKMSTDEFAKYEKQIKQAMIEGKIQ